MTYQEATDWLFKQLPMFSRIGAPAYKPGLETSHNLDLFFNHPHRNFKSIHIGGTNGKGSTSHLISSVLQEAGYKTALYTSPHLIDFRERMKINGKMIPKEKVIEFVEKWKLANYDGKPSFFELTMMMAFDWFAKENVDYAVIEVGMGGRLDSTNIISPEISVITNISKDHTQFLGETLEQIAAEKAGIIKKGIPVIIGEQGSESVRQEFEKKATHENSSLIFAEKQEIEIGLLDNNQGYKIIDGKEEYTVPLCGDYQKKNILTVLSTIRELQHLGLKISSENIRRGLANVISNTGFMGRWMILNEQPLTIADTGHNIAGIRYNMNQLQNLIKLRHTDNLRIIIGFVADKAIDEIIKMLPKNATYYLTNASIPRALPVEELADKFEHHGLKGTQFPRVSDAYERAQKDAGKNDIIFIGGSTFIVADLLTAINKEN